MCSAHSSHVKGSWWKTGNCKSCPQLNFETVRQVSHTRSNYLVGKKTAKNKNLLGCFQCHSLWVDITATKKAALMVKEQEANSSKGVFWSWCNTSGNDHCGTMGTPGGYKLFTLFEKVLETFYLARPHKAGSKQLTIRHKSKTIP